MAISKKEQNKRYINTPSGRLMKRRTEKKYKDGIRNSVLDFLGGVCAKCGFSDRRALQIDHINGDGARERRERFKNQYGILKDVFKNTDKYQLLCANCNWIKLHENGESRNKQSWQH